MGYQRVIRGLSVGFQKVISGLSVGYHSSGDLRSRRTEQGGSTEMLCFQAVT